MEYYQQLLDNIELIVKKYDEIDRINGSKFNIFQILKVSEDELKHSLFIAELLNPSGRHGFGSLFLKLFLETVIITDFDPENAKVEIEKSIGLTSDIEGGRIDIFIEDQDGKVVIIENKIYAGDQPQQLIRYYNDLQKKSLYRQIKLYPHNLLYLTLNGDHPSEDSIKINDNLLKEGEHFRIISYKTHIIEWLELCRKETVNFPLLREGLLHYINLIKYLTGQATNENMKGEIINLALQCKKNLEMMAVIGNNYNNIKAQFHYRFWEALEIALRNENLIIDLDHRNTIKSTQDLKKNNGFWILIERIQDYWIYYSIFFDDCVYCGITIEINGEFISTKPEIYIEISEILLKSDLGFYSSQYRLGDKKITPQLNFLDLNNSEILNFVDDVYLKKYTNKLTKIIKNEISNFQNLINDKKEKLYNL